MNREVYIGLLTVITIEMSYYNSITNIFNEVSITVSK